MFSISIKKILFSNDEEIPLERNSLMILIGPNNSGKSTTLKNIQTEIKSKRVNPLGKVVKSIELQKNGTTEDLLEWLEKNYGQITNDGQVEYVTKNKTLGEKMAKENWANERIGELSNFISDSLSTTTRFDVGETKQAISVYTERPQQYIHLLQTDEEKMTMINKELESAFGKELIINWGGGAKVWFNIGTQPERSKLIDRISREYLSQLNKLPILDFEGEGLRSYVAVLLTLFCGSQPILLIDEPEAFLHPPQARRLGNILAKISKESNRQVIIATHSADIVQGALSNSENVSICRIDRDENINKPKLLSSNQIKELWSKPLLHSVNSLNGIFHEGVVVCEADADCRFYSSLFNKIESEEILRKPTDLYFIHGGGKSVISTLVKTYKSLNVKTVAITDFDILFDEKEFRTLFETFGGDFLKIEEDYKSCISTLNDLQPIKPLDTFLDEIDSLRNSISEKREITLEDKRRIKQLVSDSVIGSMAKKYGIAKLNTEKRKVCESILKTCKCLGLFIVEQGDLESWWRRDHPKAKWVNDALERLSQKNNDFDSAKLFIKEIFKYFQLI